MGVKGSGELRFPDHENESTGQDITEEFGPDGSGEVKLKDYYRGGTKVPNITENNNVPDGTSGNTEISLKDFYNAADLSFDGNLSGTTGNFSLALSDLIKVTNGHPNFDMDTSQSASSSQSWEMSQRSQEGNPGGTPSSSFAALATASFRIGNDQTNKRIIILLLKDGTARVQAGGLSGSAAAYKILPYVGLENATWTVKIEYNTNSSTYDTTNNTIGTYNGSTSGFGSNLTYSTSATYHSVPTADTFLSIPSFTGMAANGESLFADGSSRIFTWRANVPGSTSNYASSTGAGTDGNSITGQECRMTIKAVSGSDTFQTVSDYWNIALSSIKGGIF